MVELRELADSAEAERKATLMELSVLADLAAEETTAGYWASTGTVPDELAPETHTPTRPHFVTSLSAPAPISSTFRVVSTREAQDADCVETSQSDEGEDLWEEEVGFTEQAAIAASGFL